jgi:hypothetical protein
MWSKNWFRLAALPYRGGVHGGEVADVNGASRIGRSDDEGFCTEH